MKTTSNNLFKLIIALFAAAIVWTLGFASGHESAVLRERQLAVQREQWLNEVEFLEQRLSECHEANRRQDARPSGGAFLRRASVSGSRGGARPVRPMEPVAAPAPPSGTILAAAETDAARSCCSGLDSRTGPTL